MFSSSGKHQGFLEDLVALAAAVADFHRPHSGQIDQFVGFDRMGKRQRRPGSVVS